MSETTPSTRNSLWAVLRRPSARYSLISLLGTGFILGILFWGGFNTGMDATNTLEFCISCHEMRDNVYQEYQKTVHYNNRTGVRAVCSDCHVPRDWTHKIVRKLQASGEVWGTLVGTIDTKEKFEAKRAEMAQHEWDRMKRTDSRECRNCHRYDAMDMELQDKTAKKKHGQASAEESGKTCIDCHKGIAHKLPEE
ncbi:NapC/NirT family cytochrome c [Methylococcus sp. EFPC2]|uniref:NapC/NirT family cytochrome c n=1 Tax=Methylococcus sp. EFPC2 TaxID=2812648 RepID=UPI0019685F32|nr:NapC/NirT family cytochrome c [Methylococcus sp. EFPC2]QSA97435.1 NapC/NirT family cytochrome c [Methylococcus sp. EFPC2]